MDLRHPTPKPAPTLVALFPELSPDELREAEERLDRYLTLALAVFARLDIER